MIDDWFSNVTHFELYCPLKHNIMSSFAPHSVWESEMLTQKIGEVVREVKD